jgi:hypothetical protein
VERMEHESWGERLREILFKPFIMLGKPPPYKADQQS